MKNKMLLLAFTATLMGLTSCSDSSSQQIPNQDNNVSVLPAQQSNVDIQPTQTDPNFDVTALASLVQKTTNPKLLEDAINDPANNVCNLDLNKDGSIDALAVTEVAGNQLIVSDIQVQPAVELAKINITPNAGGQTANLQIQGSPAYCGNTYVYNQPGISVGQFLFLSYLMSPRHVLYASPYHYGYYSPHYSSHRTVTRTRYVTKASSYAPKQAPVANRQSTQSSQTRQAAASQRSSISTPVKSQRDFQARSPNKTVGSGGFGNRPVPSTNSSQVRNTSSGGFGSSGRSSFGSSSRSSFGSSSGRSSFGSSSRSSFGSSSRSSFGSSSRSSGRRR